MTIQRSENKDVFPHINITPLIDVLLVLLIIFMVVSPTKPSRFKTQIPQQPTSPAPPNPRALIVSLDDKLQLKLNGAENLGTTSEMNALTAKLIDVFEKRKENRMYRENWETLRDVSEDDKIEKTVFIKAPRSIAYGEVAKVVDGVMGAGARPVSLQIDDLP